MNLEEAINIHIVNERKDLHPANHSTVIHRAALHIKVYERAPRDSRGLKALLEKKKKELARAKSVEVREDLYTEMQACERLLGMVRACKGGKRWKVLHPDFISIELSTYHIDYFYNTYGESLHGL